LPRIGASMTTPGHAVTRHIPEPIRTLWLRITEPRIIAIVLWLQYMIFAAVGTQAAFDPPASIEGEVGANAMVLLARLLVFGGTIGSVAALRGIWWLERSAVLSIGLSAALYLIIIIGLHLTEPGNRLLQAGFVASVLLHQVVRWVRIRDRSYRPEAPTAGQV